MPTILTHTAVPLALGLGLGQRAVPRRLLLAGAVAAILPDLDVVAFRLHIAYADTLGHRGASHSLAFALFVAVLAAWGARQLQCNRRLAFAYVAVCAASHPLLDMFTNGGLGVALWWPWSDARMFTAWQVMEVSPLSLSRILSARGLAVLQSELLWVWLPAALVCGALWLARRAAQPAEPGM